MKIVGEYIGLDHLFMDRDQIKTGANKFLVNFFYKSIFTYYHIKNICKHLL